MRETGTVLVERTGPGIAIVRLNRPAQLNIPTIGARKRYADLIFKASIDDDVKVLVIRGIGDHLGTDEIVEGQATLLRGEIGG